MQKWWNNSRWLCISGDERGKLFANDSAWGRVYLSFANDFAPDYSAETINKGADKMYMGFATGLFVISYFIQLLLCIKAENKHIRRIPLYLCVLGAVYSTMLYFEFFGLYHTGSWMQLEAYIYFIVLIIIGLELLLAKITHIIIRAVKNR